MPATRVVRRRLTHNDRAADATQTIEADDVRGRTVRNVPAEKKCRLGMTDACPIDDVRRDAYRSCLETF
jgi:hypothetical protein